jgi:hypothetical protein
MRVTWEALIHCTKCEKQATCRMQFDGHYTAVIIPDDWELYTSTLNAENDFEIYTDPDDDHAMLCDECQLLRTPADGLAN